MQGAADTAQKSAAVGDHRHVAGRAKLVPQHDPLSEEAPGSQP